ncbi:MAG: formylglycine-generating enzyme family protein [Acidobacteria bacterium]|nr:formylglycine-generating enzyme family protein [Acidobacteriota bacterium]
MLHRTVIQRSGHGLRRTRLIGLTVLLVLLAGSAVAGTFVSAAHVTAAAGWKTSIMVYARTWFEFEDQNFTILKYSPTGAPLGQVPGVVHGDSWCTIPPEELNYEGSAAIVSDDNLVVKVAYQFGDTPSVCEFYLKGGVQNQWILPNSVRPWMDWTGLAVLNTGFAPVDITVEAHKDGVPVAVMATPVTLAPQAKFVSLSDQIWAGIGYTDADTFVVTASAPIQAPLSITGNHAQDRHLFFAAQPALPIQDPLAITPAGTDVWASHITAAAGWRTGISIYNPSNANGHIDLYRYDEAGADLGAQSDTVAPYTWRRLDSTWLQYEGSAHITSSRYLLVKLEFQYGDTPSACEFYLTGDRHWLWLLPNTVRPWMDWTGLAAVNHDTVVAEFDFWAALGQSWLGFRKVPLDPHAKYVRLTDGIWTNIEYPELDTIVAEGVPLSPAPISITGNTAQDRHLFFAAQPLPQNRSGELVWVDDIVGWMLYIRHGEFTQGSPADAPCRETNENQFAHTISRNFVTMQSEVTRGMWAALQAVQPSLPADPSQLFGGDTEDHPVQRIAWQEALLFANLLSAHRNLKPCYYKDAAFTVPVTAANYTSGSFYCDFGAPGFRLPTEGEWEFMCRGGDQNNPFPNNLGWEEHDYTTANCGLVSTSGMYHVLESLAWFGANCSRPQKAGTKTVANVFGQEDMLGNVWEWCWDWYAAYPTVAMTDYAGPDSGVRRVLRGGAWDCNARYCRAANRESHDVLLVSLPTIGFRLVRTYP